MTGINDDTRSRAVLNAHNWDLEVSTVLHTVLDCCTGAGTGLHRCLVRLQLFLMSVGFCTGYSELTGGV